MRSVRKVVLLVAAVVAVMAISLPAVASATSLTYFGKPVAVGSKFSATSVNFSFKNTIAGPGACQKVTLPSEVLKNSGGIVEAEGDGFGTAQSCVLNFSNTSISNLDLRNIRLESPTAGKVSLKFNMWVLGENCTFERTDVPIFYSSGGSSFRFINAAINAVPKWCGPLTINADFSLTNTSGNPLILN